MSLIAHYPLNGDLNDYSGNQNIISSTNSGFVDGKIGKCLALTKTGDRVVFNNTYGKGTYSICMWLKTNATKTTWETILCDNQNNKHQLLIDSTSNTLGYWNGSWNSFGFDIPRNTWTHITLIYDTNNQTAKIYKNGLLVYNGVYNFDFGIYPIRALGNIEGGNYFGTCFNDVRIYNHSLSLKEAREVYKTKILHYKFDNPYEEPTTNLLETSYINFITTWGCYDGINEPYHTWGRHINYEIINNNNKPIMRCFNIGNNTSLVGTCLWGYLNTSTFTNGDFITFSVKIKANNTDTIGKSFMLEEYTTNNGQGSSHITRYTFNNTWVTVSHTWQFKAGDTNTTLYILTENSTFDFMFYEPQIEKKDHATPFVNGVRDSKILDCSGFNNHGIQLLKNITVSKDSILGNNCFKSSEGQHQSIRLPSSIIKSMNNSTISFWHKNSVTLSDWMILNGEGTDSAYGGGNNYLMATGAGSGPFYHSNVGTPTLYRDGIVQGYPATDQNWHHYVATGVNISTWGNLFINNYHASWDIDGFIDDFRIYATELSQEDILELYQTRCYIDKKGNLHCNEFIENINPINEPTTVRITSSPYQGTLGEAKIYINGAEAVSGSRDWHIALYDRTTRKLAMASELNSFGAIIKNPTWAFAIYDTYNSTTRVAQQEAFVKTLQNINSRKYFIIVIAGHAPEFFNTAMADEIKKIGGSQNNLNWINTRKSYACIGYKGANENNALIEALDNVAIPSGFGVDITASLSKPKADITKKGVFSCSELVEFSLDGLETKVEHNATWVKLFYHNCVNGTVVFSTFNEFLSINTDNKYSIIHMLERFRQKDGKFELLLEYPEQDGYNRWKQSSNFTNENIAGYEAVQLSWTDNLWGGLVPSTTIGSTFVDGSPNGDTWYYAIGLKINYQNGMPANSPTLQKVIVWARIDDNLNNVISIYKNGTMKFNKFIEN